MKKIILFIFLICSFSLYAATDISGTIGQDTTWTTSGDGIVRIVGDINIPDGLTLTIEPGVIVHYADSVRIQVEGTLNAIGTVTDSIIFEHETAGLRHHGIDFEDGEGTLRYCRIEDGFADSGEWNHPYSDRGGGILILGGSPPILNIRIENCLIQNNHSYEGGGVFIRGAYASPIIRNSIIRNNTYIDYGGGIVIHDGSSLSVQNCIIAENSTLALLNGVGGGMLILSDVQVDLINTVFYSNSAGNPGGGGLAILFSGNTVMAKNCIFWNNSATGGGADEIETGIYTDSLTVEYCDVEGGYTGTGNIDLYPVFTDTANQDFHFAANSPLVDAGTNTGAPADDFDGNTRPFDGDRDGTSTVDIGPYEYINTVPQITSIPITSTLEDEVYNYQVAVLDPDAEEVITYSLSVAPSWLGINSISGLISGTPTNANVGDTTVTVVVSDLNESTDNQTYTLTVQNVNDAPVAVNDAANTDEDVAIAIDVLANDSDLDGSLVPASVTVTGGPTNGGTSVNTTTGAITYTPTASWFGEDTFTYTVEDDSGAVSNAATVTVTVNSVNDAPVAVNDAGSTNEDVAVVINVLSNDSDSDGVLVPASVLLTSGPSNGGTSINTTTGEITYTAAADWFGEDTFTYTVEDDSGAVSNAATVTVTVGSVNDAPVAVDDAAGTNEDVAVVINVLVNDSDIDGVLVPSSVIVTGGPSNGGTSVNTTTGEITYTAAADWFGEDTFTYTVEDDSGAVSNAATVTVTVSSVNDPPVAVDDAAGTNEDVAVVINVLVNDSDIDGVLVPSSVIVTGGPSNGGTSINTTTGEITYTPAADWFGEDTFTYTVEDDGGAVSNAATVTVTVNSVNDAPVAGDDVANTDEDTAVIIDVLANDSDSDGILVPSSVSVTGGPTNGGTSVNTTTGAVTYTPIGGWNGVDTFIYTVEDDSGAVSNTATVSVSVGSVNDFPIAVDDAAGTNEEVAVIIDVLANDTDSDGVLVPSSVTVTNDPTNGGTSVNTTTGEITYTPAADWFGEDTFTYTVEDDSGAVSNEATVTVTVNSVNDPPVAVDDVASTNEDVAVTIDVLANDTDSDGVLVPSSVTVTGGPSNGGTSVNTIDGTITYTPNPEFNGIDTLNYTVEDDSGAVSNIATVTITVDSVNDAPVILPLPELAFNEDDSLVYSISELYNYVTDPDHPDSMLRPIFYNGNFVTVMFDSDSSNVIMKAPQDLFGSDTLELVVSDGELSDTAQVFVTVNPINDAPVFVNWPDTIQFTDLSDTVLIMIDYVNDIDSPDTSLTWQIDVSNATLNGQFDSLTTELTLTAPGFNGVVTLYCTVTDDSSTSVLDSFAVKVVADPTGIEDFVTQIPEKYFLNQNYPNPFNPVTKIEYGLPYASKVKLDIYNVIGQKIYSIVHNYKPAGIHSFEFNGKDLSSGIYFYHFQAKNFNKVKKMVLIK